MPKIKSKTKPARQTPAKRKAPGRKAKYPTHLVEEICALTDPFCAKANGSKYPDQAPIRTMPFTDRAFASVSSGTGGSGAVLILPDYFYFPNNVGTVTGDTAAYGVRSSSGTFSDVSQYRIVSWGIRLRSMLAPLNASGVVRIRMYAGTDGSAYSSVSVKSPRCAYAQDIPIKDLGSTVVVGLPIDNTARFYHGPSSSSALADWVCPGWCALQVAIEGAPASTTVLDYDYVFNYELVFNDGSVNNLIMTSAPPSNPILTDAVASVTSAAKPVFRAGVEAVGRYVKDAAIAAIAARFPATRPLAAIANGYSAMEVD